MKKSSAKLSRTFLLDIDNICAIIINVRRTYYEYYRRKAIAVVYAGEYRFVLSNIRAVSFYE